MYRYRIEHSVAADDAQVARMAELGIIASIQPSFPAVIWNEEDIRNLGEEEGMNNMFRWRDYMNAGVFIVASSYNPPTWDGSSDSREYYDDSHISAMGLIYRSVTQIGLGGTPPEGWMLERALTVDELLPLLTINGAFATFEEDVKGSLSPGKWADLVILSDDPLAVDPNDLIALEVWMTMVGGNVEYCSPGYEDLCP
jgi:predicted amidohydrolase YtcJ